MGYYKPLWERVLEKTDRRGPHECWLWTGACTPAGRPFIHLRLDKNGRQITEHAARAMYRMAYGADLGSDHVHHLCKNAKCVNPAHLELLAPGEHMKAHTVTHCKRAGHEYTPENTRIDKQGRRFCRACAAERAASLREKNRDKDRAYQREYQKARRARLSASRSNLTDN